MLLSTYTIDVKTNLAKKNVKTCSLKMRMKPSFVRNKKKVTTNHCKKKAPNVKKQWSSSKMQKNSMTIPMH